MLVFAGREVGRILLHRFTCHTVTLGRPLAEVGQLAALTAKRPVFAAWFPNHFRAASGTGDLGRLLGHVLQSVQKVSSKGMESAQTLDSPGWMRTKRILSMYLLAEISGTPENSSSTPIRIICAGRAPDSSIC